ncbi:MAG: DUF2863 family protein [Oxalobacteraceae bacterium]|nr:DUF2863 family protein [Oxalobacteraceae bacterium]
MRRPSKSSSPKLSADSQRLIGFGHAIAQSASRLEERAWERNLDILSQKLLKSSHQDTIDAALDNLFKADLDAYDSLVEAIEATSESCQLEQDGTQFDALLIAAPILAWTRFAIPSGPIAEDIRLTLAAQLGAHLLADGAQLTVAPALFSIDQLPHTHAETFALTRRMAQAALKNSVVPFPAKGAETVPFLADTRYLLATVVVPTGAPLFRWQMQHNQPNVIADQQQVLAQWQAQAAPSIARLLPGCGIELLLPEAYYIACREADKQIRPAAIRAAVHYLTHTLNLAAAELRAIIGGFGDDSSDEQLSEYRIGFAIGTQPEIVYGIVWPLYGEEDDSDLPLLPEQKRPIETVMALLQEEGVTSIKRHNARFPIEFCDDCGTPLFADDEGELVHPEMPEDTPQGSEHFH